MGYLEDGAKRAAALRKKPMREVHDAIGLP
jgi:hypothetical protein